MGSGIGAKYSLPVEARAGSADAHAVGAGLPCVPFVLAAPLLTRECRTMTNLLATLPGRTRILGFRRAEPATVRAAFSGHASERGTRTTDYAWRAQMTESVPGNVAAESRYPRSSSGFTLVSAAFPQAVRG